MTSSNDDLMVDTDHIHEIETKRIKFSKEEDKKLTRVVSAYGRKNWKIIAAHMPGRTAKQCRDRYTNYLLPTLSNSEWTESEDKLLLEKYAEIGPKWSVLRDFFVNRSANNIKNRWHVHLAARQEVESQNKASKCRCTTYVQVNAPSYSCPLESLTKSSLFDILIDPQKSFFVKST